MNESLREKNKMNITDEINDYRKLNEKSCKTCDYAGPEDSFPSFIGHNGKIYYRRDCKDCVKKYRKIYRKKLRAAFQDLKKETICVQCGNNDWRVIEWHHRDPNEKSFSIGDNSSSYGLDRIKQEIDKCTPLCANCHRIVEYEIRHGINNDN